MPATVDSKDKYLFNGQEYEGNQFAAALIKCDTIGIPTTAFVYAGNGSSIIEVGFRSNEEMKEILKMNKEEHL